MAHKSNYGLSENAKKWVEDVKKGQVGSTTTTTPSRGSRTRNVSMSAAGKRRARSVGVSSSSRQRTHRRGPSNRKKR